MSGYGRIFSIFAANYRNVLSGRSTLPNAQSYATIKARDLIKMGLPPKPKRPLTPFFKFLKSERLKVMEQYPQLDSRTIISKVAQHWTNYDRKEKEILQKDYDSELVDYSKQIMMYQQSITSEQKEMIRAAKEKAENKLEKRKFKKKAVLLGKPKKPPTAFIQYLQENKFIRGKDVKLADWVQANAVQWRTMSLQDKSKYQVEFQRLLDQYRHDIREWEEKMVRQGHIDVVRTRGLIDLKSAKSE